MVVAVHHVRGKRLPRPVASVLGNGLLERARSAYLGGLGLLAALGLGMVALTANQDWPSFPPSPLPAAPADRAAGGEGGAERPRAEARIVAGREGGEPRSTGTAARRESPPADRGQSSVPGSGELAAARVVAAPAPATAAPQPDRRTTPGEGAEPAAAPQPAAPTATASASAPSAPAVATRPGKGKSKGNAWGRPESPGNGSPGGPPASAKPSGGTASPPGHGPPDRSRGQGKGND